MNRLFIRAFKPEILAFTQMLRTQGISSKFGQLVYRYCVACISLGAIGVQIK